ncbi:uncharacterized protein SOCE26_061090 [Sorangium cellulosum]|uniref:Flagellin N-methylase n=1 Tax=Sorangium cellulosum TaxID=56 RepID=A0A2L0EZD3_SORCE|nr:uncharacterized protein SOCE26_061090 [Sorangium cellulosum]
MARLRVQIDEASREARALDAARRWREQTPCFFLNAETAACSIYPVRPLVCRLHNSVDQEAPAPPRAAQPGLVPPERLVASNAARNTRKRERKARRNGK